MSKTCTLIFVYNAKSGLLNSAIDGLHKVISPSTYACHLCSISYGYFGMHKDWANFLESLPYNIRFSYKNELELELSDFKETKLPAVFLKSKGIVSILIPHDVLNTLDLDGLKYELTHRLLK